MAAWLKGDGLAPDELPAWARRGAGDRLVMAEEGLAWVHGRRAAVVRWDEVLGFAVEGDRAFVLVPRRPPEPPWLEVDPAMVEPSLSANGFAELGDRIRARQRVKGYREAVGRRAELDAAGLEARIRSSEDLPGAVEVPALPTGKGSRASHAVALGLVGFLVLLNIVQFAGAFDAAGLGFGWWFPIAVVLTAGIVWLFPRITHGRRDRKRRRLLVLAPDGCMVALTGGARACTWSELGPLELENDQLRLRDRHGETIGVLDTRWLDAPPGLVHAVAEAYRTRARL